MTENKGQTVCQSLINTTHSGVNYTYDDASDLLPKCLDCHLQRFFVCLV